MERGEREVEKRGGNFLTFGLEERVSREIK